MMSRRSAICLESSDVSGFCNTKTLPSLADRRSMGWSLFVGLGAKAPVMAVISAIPSSTKPLGKADDL